MQDVILPLTIQEVFDVFFADDAPYFISRIVNEHGDKITDEGKWVTEFADIYKTSFGRQVSQVREVAAEFFLPPNPIVTGGIYHKFILQSEKSNTDMVFEEIAVQSGMAYADAFQVHVKWEFRTPDPLSMQTAFRQTFYLDWINRPWGIASVLEGIAKS